MFLLLRKKKLKFFLVLLFVFNLTSSCYLLNIAQSQHRLYSKRKPVSELLKSKRTDPEIKSKLLIVNKALEYAKSESLSVGNSYTEVIFNHKKSFVSFLVQAAYPFDLKWVTWSYPVVGTVPYQGFFHKDSRNREAEKWEARGYDVKKGKAQAFSTLGWFADPIYTSMLRSDETDLVETIFHELVHRTYWIKDDVKSNEQLATFLSQRMTVQYLKEKSLLKELQNYELYLKDRKIFFHWFTVFKQELRVFYKTLDKGLSKEEKNLKKKRIFGEFLVKKKPKFNRYDFTRKKGPWNNADVLSRSLYSPDTEAFERYYTCVNPLRAGDFLKALKESPKMSFQEKLESFCSKT